MNEQLGIPKIGDMKVELISQDTEYVSVIYSLNMKQEGQV